MQNHLFGKNNYRFSATFLLAAGLTLLAGCGDGGSVPGTTITPLGTTATVASLQISAIPTTVKSDNSTTSTISVTAVSATNSTIPNATIAISTDTGLLSSQLVTTDTSGKAMLTFSSGAANKDNRTATVTATAGSATALLPIQIVGSTVTLTSTGTSLPSGGASPVTMTVTAKDAGGSPISGATVTLTQTGSGTVTLTPTTGTTDATGKLVVTVAGGAAGTATVTAAAVGATSTQVYTVNATTITFGISQLTLNPGAVVSIPTSPKTSAMKIGDSLLVQVTAPAGTTQVAFVTTIGYWNGTVGTTALAPVPCVGTCTATLNTATAGVANVQVIDLGNPALSDTLTVGMTASTPAKILLQATPTVVPKSIGSTIGYSNLVATVYDANGAPVGGAPVAFSIVSGTGTNSGETVSPVLVFSASSTSGGLALGAAPATFTSGSLSSFASGVQIRASVLGTTIATQPIIPVSGVPATASSLDAAIVVGGTAGSVAFGMATKIGDAGSNSTIYTYAMSVLVADSNGSPAPLGTVVNISTWPIAWSTGYGCRIDADGFIWDPLGTNPSTNAATGWWVAGDGGTFLNEDANENLILDIAPAEDGVRKYYAGGTAAGTGTKNSQITPANSYGGTVASTNPGDAPGTATTDATGLATFTLTYTKSSANWIVARIRAQAVVQGTPAVGQLEWRLVSSVADSSPICYLPPSPFTF